MEAREKANVRAAEGRSHTTGGDKLSGGGAADAVHDHEKEGN